MVFWWSLEKTHTSEFFNDYQNKKNYECLFFQIAREIMPFPISNAHEKSNTVPKKVIQLKLLVIYIFRQCITLKLHRS